MKTLFVLCVLLLGAVFADDYCKKQTDTTDPCGEEKLKERKPCKEACDTYAAKDGCDEKKCKWTAVATCLDSCPDNTKEADCTGNCVWEVASCEDTCSGNTAADCGTNCIQGTCAAVVCTGKLQPACESDTNCEWGGDPAICTDKTTCVDITAEPACTAAKCTWDGATKCQLPDCGVLTTKDTCDDKLCTWTALCKPKVVCGTTKDKCKADEGCKWNDGTCTRKPAPAPTCTGKIKDGCKVADQCKWATGTCGNQDGQCTDQDSEEECCARELCQWVECSGMGLVVNTLLLFTLPILIFLLH